MALFLVRSSTAIRFKGIQHAQQTVCKQLDTKLGVNTTFIASLTSCHGQPAKRKKPWPYKTKGFRYWHLPFDRVDSRLDDNSKIIVIDGNIATGKTDLGQKIAKEFDMLYVPDVSDTDMYQMGDMKIDVREFDEQLPVKARSCDFEKFYSQSGPKNTLNNFARSQYELFRHKVFNYAQNIVAHLLNTGQGVVMNRGMWSDLVFAYSLRKHGYMSPTAIKAYQFQYDMLTIQECWHPHLIIYLDAPVDMVRKNIKKRNVPWEVNSPVLTDDFLQTVSDTYKNKYLPAMKVWSEVLTYDLANTPVPDIEVVVEDLESLDLDNSPRDQEKRFSDWNNVHNRDYNTLRSRYSKVNEHKLSEMFSFHPPYEAPELVIDGDDKIAYEKVLARDPRLRYSKDHQPDDKMRLLRLF